MIEAKIIEREVFIQNKDEGSRFYNNGYGIWCEQGLKLSLIEALYLVEKGEIVIKDENDKTLTLKDIVNLFSKMDKKFWLKYSIYNDLKKRGFNVKPGFSEEEIEFLMGEGGKKFSFNYIVIGLEEGVKLDFNSLTQMVDEALRSQKELILAIIDKEGNISYYTVTKLIR